jgi:hypothetical protein
MNLKGKIPLQKKVEFINWTVLGVFLLLSWLFLSADFTLGILAGGLISILNFFGLCRGLQSIFGNPEGKGAGKSAVMFKYLSRLVTKADIFGMVIGLSTVVFSIIISVIMTLFDKSYLEEV